MQSDPSFPVLLLGFGNLDREDDGVAWHILARLAARLGREFPSQPEEFEYTPGEDVDFLFSLQLVPEMADTIKTYRRVCFIDAHTGAVPEDLNFQELTPEDQISPFTHHLTSPALLNLAHLMYGSAPQAVLVSVRGYAFNFSQELSPGTGKLANQAVERILDWLHLS